ncbi:trichohyalin-like [Condylostylus longicornis]|uniref:trichohyalin-like n=1 Tax=Condylostylus longicornis TaxID=2530218 RepID=UPI00244DC267|nr:trichohyalin-like [Condylostylus longicornis]
MFETKIKDKIIRAKKETKKQELGRKRQRSMEMSEERQTERQNVSRRPARKTFPLIAKLQTPTISLNGRTYSLHLIRSSKASEIDEKSNATQPLRRQEGRETRRDVNLDAQWEREKPESIECRGERTNQISENLMRAILTGRAETKDLVCEKEKMREELEKLEKENNQIPLLVADVAVLKTKKDELEGLLNAQEKHLKSAHSALDRYVWTGVSKNTFVFHRLESERCRLLSELAAVERLYSDALKEANDMKKLKDEAEMLQQEEAKMLEIIKEQLEKKKEEIKEKTKLLENLQYENAKLTAEIKALQVQLPGISEYEEKNQLLETLRNHRVQYELLQEELNSIRSRMKEAESLNERYQKASEEMKGAAEQSKTAQTLLKAKLAAAESREAELIQQIETRRDFAISDTREKRSLIQELGDARDSLQILEEQFQKMREEKKKGESRMFGKIKMLKLENKALEEANETLRTDLEATLKATSALHHQVSHLRSSGRLLNDLESSIYREKEISNQRRSVEVIQRISVIPSNRLYRTAAVQAGRPKTGGLVWDLRDRSSESEKGQSDEEFEAPENVENPSGRSR